MGILDRYIVREYFKIMFFCLSALFVIYFAVLVFEKARRYARYEPSVWEMTYYFLLRVPEILLDIIPLAVLMGAVLTLGVLSRRNEITAMQSGGVSPVRIAVPFVIISLFISFGLLMVNLSLLPALKQKSVIVKQVQIQNRSPEMYYRQSRIWLRAGPNKFMNIQLADSEKSALFDVSLYTLNENFSLREYLQAERILYDGKKWVVYNGIKKVFLADGRIEIMTLNQVVLSLDRNPEEFIQIERDAENMTFAKLSEYAKILDKEGYEAQRYWVDLYTKTSLPFIPFVFTMIGAPVGLRWGKGRGISRGIALCLIMTGIYWIVFSLCISFGYGNVLPPLVSSWLSNIIFGLAGLYLMIGVGR